MKWFCLFSATYLVASSNILYLASVNISRQSCLTVGELLQVFLEYSDIAGASKAKASLHGRRFDENLVVAVYYPEDKFAAGDYGG